jgi:hypothetical protein
LQPAGWQYPTSAGRQFGCLLRRNLLGSTRNPFNVAGRWVDICEWPARPTV